MHMRLFTVSAILVTLLLCGAGIAQANPGKSATAPADRFAAMDEDKDGKVSREEFFKAQPTMKEGAFAAIDKDGDGNITAEEWTSFVSGHGKDGGAMPAGHPPVEGSDAAPGSAPGSAKSAPDLMMPPSGK